MLKFIRATAIALGSALAAVGMYASYVAYAGAGYLQIGAPLVALAAALIPAYAERAFHDRQYARALALALVWVPCFAFVVFNAIERNHAAKAGGEAERAAMHTAADRAARELADAKADARVATAAADKVRGLDEKHCKAACKSALASETAAKDRVAAANKALTAAQGAAVSESNMKAPEWLLPVALEIASIFLIACGFGLGREHEEKQSMPIAKPEAKPIQSAAPVLTARQIAARKGWETRRRNAAIAAGKVVTLAA